MDAKEARRVSKDVPRSTLDGATRLRLSFELSRDWFIEVSSRGPLADATGFLGNVLPMIVV